MGFFDIFKKKKKMSDGLEKTRTDYFQNIVNTLTSSVIDDDLYNDLEEQLILADVGPSCAVRLVDELRDEVEINGLHTGQEALDALEKDYYDLIISDIMMPNMDGYELVRSLRDAGDSIPVLMVTAKDAFDDMRMGFLSGTDDYMVKPVNINELVLRVGALLRRAQMINERKQRIGDTILECDSLTVSTSSESMVLPQKEFMLLYKMVSFPGKIFTRQQLMDDIWGYASASDAHTVDVHIGRLRERFRDNPDFKIMTIRGVGYKVVKA